MTRGESPKIRTNANGTRSHYGRVDLPPDPLTGKRRQAYERARDAVEQVEREERRNRQNVTIWVMSPEARASGRYRL